MFIEIVENVEVVEVRMEKQKSHRLTERYGIMNIVIAIICIIFLVINSIVVSDTALYQLASNKYVAYILNFLAGCEGKLGAIGSMSKVKVFGEGEWWRLVLHMYLHAGVLHMAFNVVALLFAGKVVEKRIGALLYLLVYHLIAFVNAIITCLIFPDSIAVGASAGIFGVIGILCVIKWKKDAGCEVTLKKGEVIYLIVFSVLSLLLGFESFVTHFIAFVFGVFVGLVVQKKNRSE